LPIFYSVVFSPDGRLLASGSNSGNVRLWDVDTGELLTVLHQHQQLVWLLAFSPDNRILATGSSDQTICLWDSTSGQLQRTLQGQPTEISALAIHPTGRWLASGGADRRVHLWDLSDAQQPRPQQSLTDHTGWIRALAFEPQGHLLASAGYDRMIHLWEMIVTPDSVPANKMRLVRTLHGHDAPIEAVAFHPDAKLLASAGWDKAIHLWDVETGVLLHILRGHERVVWSLAFSRDGRYLFSAGSDETVCQWELAALNAYECYEPMRRSFKLGKEVITVHCPARGPFLVANAAHFIYLFDHELQVVQRFHSPSKSWVWDMAVSADGSLVATTTNTPKLHLWEMQHGTLRQTLDGHSVEPLAVVLTPDDITLCSASVDGEIRLWDVATGACRRTLRLEKPYAGMNITGVTGITDAQRTALKALGAVEDDVEADSGVPRTHQLRGNGDEL
ncbi:MAG: WD40 repeat domain-containing protein, partial [Caldilineaceae bacterium]|nr:WD40 repeat domain-containing protein [Caldilineaceae bacterium]